MIKIENGTTHIHGEGTEILSDLASLLVTIATNNKIHDLMEPATFIATKILEEDAYVSHDSSDKS